MLAMRISIVVIGAEKSAETSVQRSGIIFVVVTVHVAKIVVNPTESLADG
jgi:hypothetical protein